MYVRTKNRTDLAWQHRTYIYRPYYIDIYCWHTDTAMHDATNTHDPDMGAITIGMPVEIHEQGYIRPAGNKRAEIHLCNQYLTPRIITHELFHAVCRLTETGILPKPIPHNCSDDPVWSRAEERCAYWIGDTLHDLLTIAGQHGGLAT